MKRWLICLVPWMAMTAAAQQDVPRRAQVVYTNVGPAVAWRIGDDAFVAPSVLTSWHWPFTLVGNDATIQAEGRTVRVAARAINNRMMIPLHDLFDQLGGVCSWRSDGSTMDVFGQVRIVSIRNGALCVDSTLSSKPHVFTLSGPSRVVVDLRGMRLDPKAAQGLPEGLDISQNDTNTVRVVYETENLPKLTSNLEDSTRAFILQIPGSNANTGLNTRPVEPGSEAPAPTSPPQGAGGSGTNQVGTITVALESARSTTLDMPLSRPLAGPVRMKRVNATTVEVILPGATYQAPMQPLNSPTVRDIRTHQESDGVGIEFEFTRAVAVELSTSDRVIELILVKGGSGDGKLAGKTVVVDAGHGGHDTGARSPNKEVLEKDLTLLIATQLANQLASEGANVIMTRSSDVFIPLKERPAIANRNNADLFISIHINSNVHQNSESGTITFYHGKSTVSQLLGECVLDEMAKVSGLPRKGVWSDTRIYQSGFAVLRYSQMPAILIENGFINNSVDCERMCSPEFQSSVARAIVRGVKVFLGDAKAAAN